MKNLTIIIQARTGSTRMPNKMIIPFAGNKTILEIIVERLKLTDTRIIIATTNNKVDDALVKIIDNLNVDYFRGSENDVLNRFIKCAEYFNCENIIRVCADNPFLNLDAILELINVAYQNESDYIGFIVNKKPSIKTHFGFWAEFVTLDILKKISYYTTDLIYHEHVTNYIYEHPEFFNIKWINTSPTINGREDIRLTIDTEDDFLNGKLFYNLLYKSEKNNITLDNLINLLDENPFYLEVMKKEILKNSK